jgi:hypothetical protein
MSLSQEFFDERDALIRQRELFGDVELEHFLKPRHVSVDRPHRLGLLIEDRGYMSTADFFVHEVTEQGGQFLEGVEDYQLIFVRRDAAADFATLLNRAKRQKISSINRYVKFSG